jgi:hypothetical protein
MTPSKKNQLMNWMFVVFICSMLVACIGIVFNGWYGSKASGLLDIMQQKCLPMNDTASRYSCLNLYLGRFDGFLDNATMAMNIASYALIPVTISAIVVIVIILTGKKNEETPSNASVVGPADRIYTTSDGWSTSGRT